MIVWFFIIKQKDGKLLPSDSIVHKNYYEIHIDRSILNKEKIAVLYWFRELLIKLKTCESKPIVFEVSGEIITEKRIKSIFSDDSVALENLEFISKLVAAELTFFEIFNPKFWLKKKKKIKRKKIKRYVIDFDSVNWEQSINIVDDYIKKFENKYSIRRKKINMSRYIEKNTIIETDLLPFPNALGNNGDLDIKGIKHGCLLCQYLIDYENYDQPLNIYSILSSTSSDEFYLDICKKSVHCMKLLNKFQSGTYKSLADGGDGKDDITIGLKRGDYTIYEGKHRVCVAKRFNVKTIPVILECLKEEYPLFHKNIKGI